MKNWRKVAKKFGVNVSKSCDPKYSKALYLSFTGESVEGVYFYPEDNLFRLRKPGFGFVKGDWASAIAIAVTRTFCFDHENCEFTKTIRSFMEK